MFNRLFTTSVRATAFLTALAMTLGLTGVVASPSEAALKKYNIRTSQLLHYTQTSPRAEYRSVGSGGMSLIDDDGGGNPVLKKQLNGSGTLVGQPGGATTITPGLSGGFIYYKGSQGGGPDESTGTGSTAGGATITWGTTLGWTLTGGVWCNSNPTYICDLAQVVLNETVGAQLLSTQIDLGFFVFHGTGYTHGGEGYLSRTGPTAPGNIMQFFRGPLANDGTVPALPLLGLGTIGVSVIAMGVASIRRNRK